MKWIQDLLDDFLSLLFPRVCYGCGCHLMRNEYLICMECMVVIPKTNFHMEKDNQVEKIFWGRCVVEKAAAFSYYNKDSRIRRLIHNLKYKGVKDIGNELGRIYGSVLREKGFTDDIDMIIPVPLHPAKRRLRGFNQSELIAEGISAATDIPVSTDIIQRITATSTQTKRGRYDRWINVEGIFSVKDYSQVKGRHLLLIDDVITTGSTAEACINELHKGENVRISFVALAFAPE